MESTPVKLELKLRAEGAALTGLLVDERGAEHAFSGWLGLLTLLEAARPQAAEPAGARA